MDEIPFGLTNQLPYQMLVAQENNMYHKAGFASPQIAWSGKRDF